MVLVLVFLELLKTEKKENYHFCYGKKSISTRFEQQILRCDLLQNTHIHTWENNSCLCWDTCQISVNIFTFVWACVRKFAREEEKVEKKMWQKLSTGGHCCCRLVCFDSILQGITAHIPRCLTKRYTYNIHILQNHCHKFLKNRCWTLSRVLSEESIWILCVCELVVASTHMDEPWQTFSSCSPSHLLGCFALFLMH